MLALSKPRSSLPSLPAAHAAALLVPTALLAGAIGSQLIGGLVPCEMCIWQRWPHVAAVVLALLAFPLRGARRALVALAGLAIAVSGAIGVYHAGVELGLLDGITTCTANATGLDQIMNADLVRCDAVQWELLGVSMAGWNAIISLSAALFIALGVARGRA
ncbi:disulfide bond formation protein B [Sphingomicrobium sp. XHP0239]|uniref:disulfide bond formation protein B n=1 Tax=Sphingomicrobium maritimum TaxID=3133972 RepID=UPI0031CC74AA